MAMAAALTPNAILALNSGETDLQPLVQVLDVRQIGTGQSVQERYRLVLSDGNYVQQAMLATQLNEFVKSGQVQKGSIVKLVEYICNTVQSRKIIIVLSMEVEVSSAEIIGDPKQPIMNAETLAAATAANQQPQRPAGQAPAIAPQPPSFGNVGGDGYKGALAVGPHAKESPASYTSSLGKPGHPVGYQGQGYSSGINAQTSGGGGMYSNGPPSTYGRPVTAPSYQPAPVYSNRGPIMKNEAPARIVPIAALNPYQGRWTIKARVTAKGDLHRYNNARGEGKVFHFDLLDAEGGEIRVTCFNNIADRFYEQIEVGKVYMLSKGTLKPVQRAYNHLKSEWEIHLENASTLEPCHEEDGSIPHQLFDFKPISEIENLEANSMVDLVGVVVTINPSSTIMRKNGTEAQKRTLQLRDTSGRSVEVTMWGSFCNNEGQQLQDLCDSGQFPVVAIKTGRISDFSGKSVNTTSSSQILVNPNLPQCFEVKEWFERVGRSTAFQSISKEAASGSRPEMRKTVAQIKDEGLGRSDKPDWIAMKATISFIKNDVFCYTACPLPAGDRQCSKKVINNGDGTWRCDKCDKSIAECDYRYLLSVQVQDHTGVTWVTAFQEAGEELMGVSARELYMWKQDETVKFQELIQKLLFSQHLFKLKVKEESYNDEQRVKSTVMKSECLDFAAESRFLIDLIGKLSRGEPIGGPTPSATASLNPSFNGGSTPAGVTSMGPPGGSYGGNLYPSSANSNPGGGYTSNTYGTGISCFKCNGPHFARECPNDKGMSQQSGNASVPFSNGGSGGGGYGVGLSTDGSSNSCFKCGQGGHWARDCPGQGGQRNAHSYAGGIGGNSGFNRGY
ncbi:hypothetical protein L7F22_028150 [Adiantum nelumboides]|nr:hypothetical protein [Adiantum nelumboides]